VVIEMLLNPFLEFRICPGVDDLKSAGKTNEVLFAVLYMPLCRPEIAR
jgi:hypothetical protein